MIEHKIIINKKKSELNATNKFDYEKLIHSSNHLIPCAYEEKEEEVIFSYDAQKMTCSQNLKKEEKINQFQFLINFEKLYNLFLEYKIILQPDNIYYDENYIPYIKERDLYGESEKPDKEKFLFFYKTFVGAVLGEKYTVKQLQESGVEVLDQELRIKPFIKATTKEDLVEMLRKEKREYYEKQKKNTVRVTKKENRIKSIVAVSTPLLLFMCVAVLCYLGFSILPYQKSIIAANEAFVQKNYVVCIDSMKEIDVENMDINSKYILAFSYAKSESLEKEEIETLTSRLSINSNEKELEYWIYSGRLEMSKAENLAQALSDDKLLIYAYLKELNQLQNDTSMDGEEKQTRISELETNIKSLGDKYAPDDEASTMETTEAVATETTTSEEIKVSEEVKASEKANTSEEAAVLEEKSSEKTTENAKSTELKEKQ